ncbi:hypothetical protein JXQ31_05085 [candidate division KSB1 bacterium]|nr:hypothetical protein [candidate division KSB1 bacterium]
MRTKCVFTQLIIVFAVFLVYPGFAQLSAYHGIVFPYEQQYIAGKSLGGVTVAAPDYVPDVRGNPAGPSFTENLQIFTGVNAERIDYELDYENKYLQESETSNTRDHFCPSQFSLAVPFRLLNKKTTVALSVNKINTPEIETLDIPEIKKNTDLIHIKNGNVWTGSIGLSTRIGENFSIGLSWTKWYGHWKWIDEKSRNTEYNFQGVSGVGNFKYNGNSFILGLLKQFHKLSAGIVLRSPITLMKAENVQINQWGFNEAHNLKQKFNGAISAGLAYRLFRNFRLGLGYRYQREFTINDYYFIYSNANNNDYQYGNAHKVSAAWEYTFNFYSIQIPAFLAYYGQWLPLTLDSNPGYETLAITKDNRFQNGAAMGLNIFYKSFGFHFVTEWQQYSIYVNQHLVYLPPYS